MQEWKELDEQLILKNEFMGFVKRRYEMPDGSIRNYFLGDYHDGVVIFALTKDKKVILVREFRPGPKAWMLDPPAGAVDDNEDTELAARRELLEESGYRPGKLVFLGKYAEHSYLKGFAYYYLALDCEPDRAYKLQESTVVGLELIEWEDFLKGLKTNSMIQIGATMLAKEYLENNNLV